MKKFLFLLMFSPVLFSCSNDKKSNADKNSADGSENNAYVQQLKETVATQDSLLSMLNEVNDGLTRIKQLENVISMPSGIEGVPSKKQQILQDIEDIKNFLQMRRERIDELENKIKQSDSENSTLLTTIKNLKEQIARQESEISELTSKLQQANIKISYLDEQVENLNNTIDDISVQRDEAQQKSEQLNDELNACYYAIGTKKELSDNNILKGGFLRKTKIMGGDFERSYFTQADKRTLRSIPLYSKKAEVMTNQPKDSYKFEDVDGMKVLQILDPEKFWELSNFLVVKIN